MNLFEKLGLTESVLEVLAKLGFTEPTPIQEQSIPLLLNEDPTDFIGLAQTGTGKTAAFGLPLVELLDRNDRSTQALIMAPTRELGQQTAKQLTEFVSNQHDLNVECVYGGANIATQIKAMKKPVHILVATPGRLLDLLKRKAVNLDRVRYVVLDEADEMLNMGFKEDIDLILDRTPKNRVTWLFSATMPKEIRKIVKKYMDSPLEVSILSEDKTNKDISHSYVITKTANKLPALRRFLEVQPDMRGVMFCRTRRETQQIADELGGLGYSVEALHGELSQSQRDAVMKRFKNKSMQLLIATDVAARGIDVNDLTHVIHHTLPDQLESYTHRSGRTGRAGKKGISLAFINPREGRKIKELENKIDISFEKIEVPLVDEIESIRMEAWAKDLLRVDVDERATDILEKLNDSIGFLTKEEILKKLISAQLKKLNGNSSSEQDLNETGGSSTMRASDPSKHRYFINIGTMDGINKGDLFDLLCDVSGLKKKHFGTIDVKKNCSFFEVDKSHDKNLAQAFKGIQIDGRPVRVNRDEDGGGPKGKPSYNGKGKGRNGKPRRGDGETYKKKRYQRNR